MTLAEAGLQLAIPADAFVTSTVAILVSDSPPPALTLLFLPAGAYARLILVDQVAATPVVAAHPFVLRAESMDDDVAALLYRWDDGEGEWAELAAGAVVQAEGDSGGLFAVAVAGQGMFLPLVQQR